MKKVLIVEDDLTIARIYQNLIRIEGAQVDIAADGEMAVEMLAHLRPGVVLLDLMLPKQNGVEVLKHIRAQEAFRELPVIVFTNSYMGTLIEEAWNAGATQCLIKAQTSPKQIMDVLRGYLKALPAAASTAPPTAVAAPPQTAPAPTIDSAVSNSQAEATFESEIRSALISRAPEMLGALRKELQALSRNSLDPTATRSLAELCRLLRLLTSNSGMAGFAVTAQLSSALEALARELQAKPSSINSSSIRTLAQGVDCLDSFFEHASDQLEHAKSPLVLVLDDDAVLRHVISGSLERAGMRTLRLGDPLVALDILKENKFDTIFLDVNMPGMDGFELCEKLRALPNTRLTPVVFVTTLTNIESRARSIMSGGNDFIAKPFPLIELTVKALVHSLKPRAEAPQADQAEVLQKC
jgi:CheY-like chemotaxis protein